MCDTTHSETWIKLIPTSTVFARVSECAPTVGIGCVASRLKVADVDVLQCNGDLAADDSTFNHILSPGDVYSRRCFMLSDLLK